MHRHRVAQIQGRIDVEVISSHFKAMRLALIIKLLYNKTNSGDLAVELLSYARHIIRGRREED